MGSRKPSCKNIIREIWLDFASTVDRHQFEWRLDPNIFSADFSAASFFSKLPHCVSGQYLTREIRLSEALPSDAFILDWSTFFFFFFSTFQFSAKGASETEMVGGGLYSNCSIVDSTSLVHQVAETPRESSGFTTSCPGSSRTSRVSCQANAANTWTSDDGSHTMLNGKAIRFIPLLHK